jgi:beta-catenin-like protein 1
MLSRRNKSLKDIVEVLRGFRDNVDDSDKMDEGNESISQKEILEGLLGFLEGCL